ncbi:phosphorylase [Marivirga tractuosa]|uniref:Uridine phosphorylase n=1 Tax=Marivirga tractuosa (strain ATCC 23168 / DSM 4126 / NBRC 15989 / NCIMB 1408 / VKM B-1430 / H-43) TaxID=643867 RepID=E4TP27_MARTH|nr:nucleoside phosphorylase [Marivirga tractuosa]ADR23561.1 purine or other phosphorylase family 1 [Marivirga tractuosa DSM 4126]BDD15760.1 phosphorylase [Marivirga tractuosa]
MEMKYPESELILNKDGSVYHLSLKPQDISDVILTVGDPSRVHKVSQYFDKITFEMNKREFITHTGIYKGRKLTVMSTGMGTDNVEILMTELDALANINLKKRENKVKKKSLKIIRIGTSGGLQQDLPVDSLLASQFAIGIDTLMQFYDLERTEAESNVESALQLEIGLPFRPYCVEGSSSLLKHFSDGMNIGNTVTCPGFYAPQGRQLRAPIRFPKIAESLSMFHYGDLWLTNFEMETAGYYAMGRLLGHEVLSCNAIVANRMSHQFSKNSDKTIDGLIKLVLDKASEL